MALPTPTALATVTKYLPVARRKFTWVPTIASKSAPTTAELTAGTDLTAAIPPDGVSGFQYSTGSVDAGDYASRFTSKLAGMQTADDSSIKTYLSTNATDARTLLTQDTSGYVVIYPEGIVASGKCDIWPVTIGSSTIDQVSAGDPATLTTSFFVTSPPALGVTIPTA